VLSVTGGGLLLLRRLRQLQHLRLEQWTNTVVKVGRAVVWAVRVGCVRACMRARAWLSMALCLRAARAVRATPAAAWAACGGWWWCVCLLARVHACIRAPRRCLRALLSAQHTSQHTLSLSHTHTHT
jgi:hypothetical protein